MVKRSQSKKGRPKDIKAVVKDSNDPDNYPTLARYLEATGRIQHTTYAVMAKAKNLFLRFTDVKQIAVSLCVEPAIIDRWVLCFSWDELRDKMMFEHYRKISGVKKMYGADVGKRHDRIAGGIEAVAERLLQRSSEGNDTLNPRDLNTIANTINVELPANMNKLADALVDINDRPRLVETTSKTIALGAEGHIGRDTEYEE